MNDQQAIALIAGTLYARAIADVTHKNIGSVTLEAIVREVEDYCFETAGRFMRRANEMNIDRESRDKT